ncbi:MAG: hypothetical protein WA021_00680 [Minisyncoccia bacterium]
MADQQQSPGLLANILAVAGFIILIVIIVWGAYHLLRLAGVGVSNIFSRFGDKNEITITVPTTPAQSGKPLSVSWQYATEEDGAYAFLYQCKAGFRFEVATPSGGASAIPCGNAFVVGERQSLSVVPVLSGTSTLEIPLSVVFMPSATSSEERPQGTATLTVAAAGSAPTTVTQPRPATGSTNTNTGGTSSTPASQPTGTPDLSVRILAVGVIDMYGNFVARAPIGPDEIAAVKFDIANNGSAKSGSYYFSVSLPMQPTYLYSSQAQAPLAPGAHIENTLRFRPAQSGGGTIRVVLNTEKLPDMNAANNSASQWMGASSYPYQYYQQYVY